MRTSERTIIGFYVQHFYFAASVKLIYIENWEPWNEASFKYITAAFSRQVTSLPTDQKGCFHYQSTTCILSKPQTHQGKKDCVCVCALLLYFVQKSYTFFYMPQTKKKTFTCTTYILYAEKKLGYFFFI